VFNIIYAVFFQVTLTSHLEVERCLRVLDGAVAIIDASAGMHCFKHYLQCLCSEEIGNLKAAAMLHRCVCVGLLNFIHWEGFSQQIGDI
jgi:hypothetical protein